MHSPIEKQRGVVLVITLIALVAMTLAGMALMRSTDTTSLIVGNLAFQQAVTFSADQGIESAVSWLEAAKNANPKDLTLPPFSSDYNNGYAAVVQNPPDQRWDVFWSAVLKNQSVTLAADDAGNQVSYAIQRMCYASTAEGKKPSPDPAVGCPVPPVKSTSGMGAGIVLPSLNSGKVYYRITVRIQGPHNTVNFVQAFVAL